MMITMDELAVLIVVKHYLNLQKDTWAYGKMNDVIEAVKLRNAELGFKRASEL
jgi:hypothetical protein